MWSPLRVNLFALSTLMLVILLACNGGSQSTATVNIDVQDTITVGEGEDVALNTNINGFSGDVTFKWSTNESETFDNQYLSRTSGPSTTFTAPADRDQVLVTVTVSDADNSMTDTVTINITHEAATVEATEIAEVEESRTPLATETPSPTATPGPTDTPTATDTPSPTIEPINCNHPELTAYVFPQLKDVSQQRAFYGPLEESFEIFLCQGVADRVHSPPRAVRIEYHAQPTRYGYFGIGTPEGFDATGFSQVCFYAFAEQPDQVVRLKMKDTSGVEDGVDLTIPSVNRWTQVCHDLQAFSALGIDLSHLENVNLGFEAANGSTTIWVDDFEFVE